MFRWKITHPRCQWSHWILCATASALEPVCPWRMETSLETLHRWPTTGCVASVQMKIVHHCVSGAIGTSAPSTKLDPVYPWCLGNLFGNFSRMTNSGTSVQLKPYAPMVSMIVLEPVHPVLCSQYAHGAIATSGFFYQQPQCQCSDEILYTNGASRWCHLILSSCM